MTTTRTRPLPLFLLSLLLLPACACDRADLDAAARFGAAASTLAVAAENELLHVRSAVIALRAERYALSPSPSLAAAGNSPGTPSSLDAGVEAPHAEARIAGARALGAFGTLLALAAADDATAGDGPAARAIEALRLRSLAGAEELSEAQAGALADLADAVAQRTLTTRRAGAVRRALLETESPIRQLAAALRADFHPEAQRWLANLVNERIEAQLLCERLEAQSARSGDVDERLARARSLVQHAARADDDARQAAERLRAAVDSMLQAHETLVAQLRDSRTITLEDVDAFLAEAERLKLTWQILRHN